MRRMLERPTSSLTQCGVCEPLAGADQSPQRKDWHKDKARLSPDTNGSGSLAEQPVELLHSSSLRYREDTLS